MSTDAFSVQTVTFTGERYVILPEVEYLRLLGEPAEPELPAPDAKGRYPAVDAARVILARKLIRARRALGWTQTELARRAGVRVETLNRLEHGKHSPNVATVDKLSRALRDGEAKQPAGGRRPSSALKAATTPPSHKLIDRIARKRSTQSNRPSGRRA